VPTSVWNIFWYIQCYWNISVLHFGLLRYVILRLYMLHSVEWEAENNHRFECIRIWLEMASAYFKVISKYLLGENEVNVEIPRSVQPVMRSKFEEGTSWTQLCSARPPDEFKIYIVKIYTKIHLGVWYSLKTLKDFSSGDIPFGLFDVAGSHDCGFCGFPQSSLLSIGYQGLFPWV